MNLKKAIQNEIDMAFLPHEMFKLSDNPEIKSGLRQVIFGLAAAAITFGIGHLIGVSITS